MVYFPEKDKTDITKNVKKTFLHITATPLLKKKILMAKSMTNSSELNIKLITCKLEILYKEHNYPCTNKEF